MKRVTDTVSVFCIVLLTACAVGVDDLTGEMRNISAAELVRDMGIAMNIGNTFDSLNSGGIAGETGWGNPKVSREFIKALKKHGYKTIRLPVSWADYIGSAPDYAIDEVWMDRVAEVTNWILAEGMYCILNVHHDSSPNIGVKSWIETSHQSPEKEAEVIAKFTALWNQIALRFRHAHDKLVFEGMNEPQFDRLWNRYQGGQAEQKAKAFRLLVMLNQTFVDTVRATGGNNEERFLLVPSYWTDINLGVETMGNLFNMPNDTQQGKLILSFHYYTPWNFCGGSSTTWGTPAHVNELDNQFNKVKVNFLDKGIPVILGEYGVDLVSSVRQSGVTTQYVKNPDDRTAWMLAVTQKCVDLGICPVIWDTGMRPNNRGMADFQREAPFALSSGLRAVWQELKP